MRAIIDNNNNWTPIKPHNAIKDENNFFGLSLNTNTNFRIQLSFKVYLCLLEIPVAFSPGDNEEELVVGWQEKLFSQVELCIPIKIQLITWSSKIKH